MKQVSLRELLEAGAHFGHKTSRWHPKAKRFIFEERDNIHIIDLAQTKLALEKAAAEVKKIAITGGKILLVGTKRQAKEVLAVAAEKTGLPYMSERWVGGMVTNWEQVKKNIDKMNKMEEEHKDGSWKTLPKHEQLQKYAELEQLKRVYRGVADLDGQPAALFIVDVRREKTAAREARLAKVFSIGICDTNANPDDVSMPIPANDDAAGSIKYITEYLVDAYVEGKKSVSSSKNPIERKQKSNQ